MEKAILDNSATILRIVGAHARKQRKETWKKTRELVHWELRKSNTKSKKGNGWIEDQPLEGSCYVDKPNPLGLGF